ncbi:MAG: large subunit ribosomal protein L21 [Francisellaceae bacterium]|jgi:large subunit ribosomal protein L21
MYAVIKSGGKQYKVKEGSVVQLEKIEKGVGETVELTEVLLLADGKETKFGNPFIEGSKVVGEVVEQARAKKIHIIKFKRRKHHMKRQGHRQYYTAIKITSIN